MEAAYILYLLSGFLLVAAMLMSAMKPLRLLALGGGIAAVAGVLLAGQTGLALVLPILFVIVNGLQLARLARGARRGGLRQEERALLEQILRVEDPGNQRRLVGLLEWRDAMPGEVLIRQGQERPPLIYAASGAAGIELNGQLIGVAGEGDFLGDMSVATGEPASTAVVVTNPMRIAVVDRTALAQMAEAAPEIGAAFDGAINRSMAVKIRRMNEAAAGP